MAGAPEDQLRAPLETYLSDLALLAGYNTGRVILVGETSLADLKTRPDYAVTVDGALVGFIEVKAPGKGADPRKFTDKHDKAQWDRLKSLPNLIYTDGNGFSLWQNGELVDQIVRFNGDVETSGASLQAPAGILPLVTSFLAWAPIAPKSVSELARVSARLCRLLRDEVSEQMEAGNDALTGLADDWRKLLFPTASDSEFADGYAQAVTFGLLVARARNIGLAQGIDAAAAELRKTSSLIGTALRLLTDQAENREALKTSLATLTRVLDKVDWDKVSKGKSDAWLYFYEDFLEVYDNALRKKTGSYYTPPEVVTAMVGLVDEALRSPDRFDRAQGLASKDVTIADPAVGTGTYLLGILRSIAKTIEGDQGEGAVRAAINAAMSRLIGFELQFGPFAVAQLRLLAEIAALESKKDAKTAPPLRLYITDTLGNPYAEQEWIPTMLEPLAQSRREANEIKRTDPITVVIGNPPYKEKAKGRGGWVEAGDGNTPSPLRDWMPPIPWGVSAHAKHLYNLYVYFWRWATWKVFGPNAGSVAHAAQDGDDPSSAKAGIVCYITVAGFLNGDGFQKMRDDLRRSADEIWIIDCSPEGHQPEVSTRIFQGVQQPVCIVLASRTGKQSPAEPAMVRYRAVKAGPRAGKFADLLSISLDDDGWIDCSSDWRAPFLPAAVGAWANYPSLNDCFVDSGVGVMPGRTWVIAPDVQSLRDRWKELISEKSDERKAALFHPHLLGGKPGDKHLHKASSRGLHGHEHRDSPVSADQDAVIEPTAYAFRSFDRQYVIPDARLINRSNPALWSGQSKSQVYITALDHPAPTTGLGFTMTALVPDLHHFSGRGGRVYRLWADAKAQQSEVNPALLKILRERLHKEVTDEDVFAYIASIGSNPAYTARFASDLVTPPLRIPFTANPKLFAQAVEIGRKLIWIQTFGERFVDPKDDRPHSAPRLPKGTGPTIPAGGDISSDPENMPNEMTYDSGARRLHVGTGFIDNVTPEMWNYAVGGKHILRQWFSYRKADRSRPIMGDRRPPSPLGDIQPAGWLAEYTTDLLNLLHVLGRLLDLEPAQKTLLDQTCDGETITAAELAAETEALPTKGKMAVKVGADTQLQLLD
ncbi:DNA methyltransferase [Nostoc sp. 3335mG]|nr:DNA methyltransferase [Nostoc sp. 3335mG]